MDQNIKNRLVGIIVIFALAVIFLPMILDGSGVNDWFVRGLLIWRQRQATPIQTQS